MTFRGYEAGDFEAMFRLDEACFDLRFRFSRRAMKRFAEARNAHVLLAEAEGKLVGFCIVHVETATSGTTGYVVTLDVAAERRREGIAGTLMRKSESGAAEAGCDAMLLHVFTGNANAVRFYEDMGYVMVGGSQGFYGVDGAGEALDAMVYRKVLESYSKR